MTEHVLSLPIPPSKNALRGHGQGRVYRTAAYRKWIGLADAHMQANKPMGGWETITGPFDAEIVIDKAANGKADPQNRVEAIFDYAQRLRLVENDKNLRNHQVTLGVDPVGCRVTLRPVAGDNFESVGNVALRVLEKLARKMTRNERPRRT